MNVSQFTQDQLQSLHVVFGKPLSSACSCRECRGRREPPTGDADSNEDSDAVTDYHQDVSGPKNIWSLLARMPRLEELTLSMSEGSHEPCWDKLEYWYRDNDDDELKFFNVKVLRIDLHTWDLDDLIRPFKKVEIVI